MTYCITFYVVFDLFVYVQVLVESKSLYKEICIPPVAESSVECTTSSTQQTSNTQTMICSVPAVETVNATVTITNAAGVTTSQSASAG